ncbi:MAG: fimbrillin family protein [Rikenellaceae bacterium]|nr:fimbrillin family protein [Rikenellaceae bacterium]
MKKSFLILAAFLTLVACSNDEIVTSQPTEAIAFGNVLVGGPTRAAFDGSHTSGSLAAFEVYGTIANTNGVSNIFNQEEVKLQGGVWTYDSSHTQYWIPGNTYCFTAVVDGNQSGATAVALDSNLMPVTVAVEDASQQKDILLAKSPAIQFAAYSTASPVALAFNHLMSKAKFTVKNSATEDDGYSYKVSDITIKSAAQNGVYDIAGQCWNEASTPATYDLSFGNAVTTGTEDGIQAESIGYGQTKESNFERLLIPTFADQEATSFTIVFSYEMYYHGTLVATETTYLSAEAKLETGHAYNFVIELSDLDKPVEVSPAE